MIDTKELFRYEGRTKELFRYEGRTKELFWYGSRTKELFWYEGRTKELFWYEGRTKTRPYERTIWYKEIILIRWLYEGMNWYDGALKKSKGVSQIQYIWYNTFIKKHRMSLN